MLFALLATSALAEGEVDHPAKKEHDPAAILAKLDVDGDGKLSVEELKSIVVAKAIKQYDESRHLHHEEFGKVDTDNDMKISKDEMGASLSSNHDFDVEREEQVFQLFEDFDADNDGFLQLEEYVHFVFGKTPSDASLHAESIEPLITAIDKNGDGHVSIEDLTHEGAQDYHLSELAMHADL